MGLQTSLNKIYDLLSKRLPSNALRIACQRGKGVKIGNNVYLAYDVNIDLVCPELVEIGDNARIGIGVIISAHNRPSDGWLAHLGECSSRSASGETRSSRPGNRPARGHGRRVRHRTRGSRGGAGRSCLQHGGGRSGQGHPGASERPCADVGPEPDEYRRPGAAEEPRIRRLQSLGAVESRRSEIRGSCARCGRRAPEPRPPEAGAASGRRRGRSSPGPSAGCRTTASSRIRRPRRSHGSARRPRWG